MALTSQLMSPKITTCPIPGLVPTAYNAQPHQYGAPYPLFTMDRSASPPPMFAGGSPPAPPLLMGGSPPGMPPGFVSVPVNAGLHSHGHHLPGGASPPHHAGYHPGSHMHAPPQPPAMYGTSPPHHAHHYAYGGSPPIPGSPPSGMVFHPLPAYPHHHPAGFSPPAGTSPALQPEELLQRMAGLG